MAMLLAFIPHTNLNIKIRAEENLSGNQFKIFDFANNSALI